MTPAARYFPHPSTALDVAASALAGQGRYGVVTHLARQHDVRRQVVYDLRDESRHVLERAFTEAGVEQPRGRLTLELTEADITRTVVIGEPTAEHRDRFTRVLQGHIALATLRFPKGTAGHQVDVLARLPLWQAGLDYDHGTGHGIGSYLGVHEGPQRVSKRLGDAPLQAGMILSNEPGYYRVGEYGIRTENLVAVVPCDAPEGGDKEMLGFETLTLAPIDRRLVDRDLLTDAEADWLNAYHARVREALAPLLDDADQAWLEAATEPV